MKTQIELMLEKAQAENARLRDALTEIRQRVARAGRGSSCEDCCALIDEIAQSALEAKA